VSFAVASAGTAGKPIGGTAGRSIEGSAGSEEDFGQSHLQRSSEEKQRKDRCWTVPAGEWESQGMTGWKA
jgi:hypothetical protein